MLLLSTGVASPLYGIFVLVFQTPKSLNKNFRILRPSQRKQGLGELLCMIKKKWNFEFTTRPRVKMRYPENTLKILTKLTSV